MKSPILLTWLALLGLNHAFAQQKNTTAADSLRADGQLKEAVEAYKLQYIEDPNNKVYVYNYACALALDKKIDSAFKYLGMAIEEDTSVRALTDPDLYFLIHDERWKSIEDLIIGKIEVKSGPYKNPDLAKELWRMKIKDQAFYYHLHLAEKKLGYSSPVVKAMWELKRSLNEENLQRLHEIIEEHGWPKISDVQGTAAGAAFLVVQHADIVTQQKYLPLMKAAADQGEANWRQLAMLIDRVNLAEGKQQVYGTQIGMKPDGTYYVSDLEDPGQVNQRRREVGLGPIEDYVAQWGIEWDVEQE